MNSRQAAWKTPPSSEKKGRTDNARRRKFHHPDDSRPVQYEHYRATNIAIKTCNYKYKYEHK